LRSGGLSLGFVAVQIDLHVVLLLSFIFPSFRSVKHTLWRAKPIMAVETTDTNNNKSNNNLPPTSGQSLISESPLQNANPDPN